MSDDSEKRWTYRITVQGRLDESWSRWFNGLTIECTSADHPTTTLTGPVVDQSALRGILNKLWDLNLTLLSVTRLEKKLRLQRRQTMSHQYVLSLADPQAALETVGGKGASLARLDIRRGDLTSARARLKEAILRYQELGDKYNMGLALRHLGDIARLEGNYNLAVTFYRESLALHWGMGVRPRRILGRLAGAFAALGKLEKAALLLGEATALTADAGVVISQADLIDLDRTGEAIRAALGEEAFATAWAKGRSMTFEQALQLAFQEA